MAGTRPPEACCTSSRRLPNGVSCEVAARRRGEPARLDFMPVRLSPQRGEIVRREGHRIGLGVNQRRTIERLRVITEQSEQRREHAEMARGVAVMRYPLLPGQGARIGG